MDQELLTESAGYVRDSFVMASLDQFSEYEYLERILMDAVCDDPIEEQCQSAVITARYPLIFTPVMRLRRVVFFLVLLIFLKNNDGKMPSRKAVQEVHDGIVHPIIALRLV